MIRMQGMGHIDLPAKFWVLTKSTSERCKQPKIEFLANFRSTVFSKLTLSIKNQVIFLTISPRIKHLALERQHFISLEDEQKFSGPLIDPKTGQNLFLSAVNKAIKPLVDPRIDNLEIKILTSGGHIDPLYTNRGKL